jgi:hypothetical protein
MIPMQSKKLNKSNPSIMHSCTHAGHLSSHEERQYEVWSHHNSILLEVLRAWITNAILVDREQAITLGQAGAVIDLADSGLPTSLLETQSGSTGMSNDVASDGLLGIGIEHRTRATINLSDDLVGYDNGNSELIC